MSLLKRIGTNGMQSTDWLYVVCAIHLSVCVALLACTTPGAEALQIGSVVISEEFQWIHGAFNCLSIVSIIAAGVGGLYLIESHLNIYFYVLLLSALGDAAIFAVFVKFGSACVTTVEDAEIEKSSVSCRFTVALPLAGLLFLLIFKALGLAVVSKARKNVRVQYGEELLPHMRKSLQESFRGFDASAGGDLVEEEEEQRYEDEDDAAEAGARAFSAASAGASVPSEEGVVLAAGGGFASEAGAYGAASLRSRGPHMATATPSLGVGSLPPSSMTGEQYRFAGGQGFAAPAMQPGSVWDPVAGPPVRPVLGSAA